MIKKVFYSTLGVLITGLFIGTAGYLYYKSQKPPVVFETMSPVIGDIRNVTVASGTIVPRKEIQIKPQIPGVIEKIYVRPGDRVQKGTALAKIRIMPNLVNLNEAENRLNKARIAYADAEQELARQEILYKKQLISQVEFKRYQVKLQTIRADLDAAQNHLHLLKEGVTQQESGANNTLITSTVTGTVLIIPVKEGDTVVEINGFNAGTTIAVIADMSALIFEGTLDEAEVGKLREGMELYLSVGALEGQEFKATLEFIAPRGFKEREGAVQFEIRAALKPENACLIRAGYSANAKIVLAEKAKVLTIPESVVLFTQNQKPYVEIEISDQRFEKRIVELGLSDGLYVEVLSGLAETDKVKKPLKGLI